MFIPTPSSKWISGTDYRPGGDGSGFLALYLRRGGALLYAGVPPWLRGLVHAGSVGSDRSVGRAYNRLVKGRYLYLRVPPVMVPHLRAAMAEGAAAPLLRMAA